MFYSITLIGGLLSLSNRAQVCMVYRLINHAGCWKNTRRIHKSDPQMTDLQILQVSFIMPLNHKKLVVYCFNTIIQKTHEISMSLLAQ